MRIASGPPRSHCGSAAAAALVRSVVATLVLLQFAAMPGCALFHRRGPSDESIAAARELSRQGVAAMETGQWQQAEDLLRKSLTTVPDDASAHRAMAEALWHRGAREEAIAQIEEAVEHDKTNASLHVKAGEMSLAVGARDAALTHAERAIRADSTLADAWALRGHCFQKMNKPDRALADLQHALEYEPNNCAVLTDVAMMYRERGQSSRCLTTLYNLLDTYPPGEEPQQALMLTGLTLMDLNRHRQASEILALAAQRGQPNADLLYYLAQSYSAAGELEQAAVTAQQALALDASHQLTRELMSQLAARTVPEPPLHR